jgi:hypothetical protein
VTPPLPHGFAPRSRRLSPAARAARSGLLAGAAAFLVTNWLAVAGGAIKAELSLVEHVFVGYRVTFAGSLIGLAYGFLFGFCAAYYVAVLYNLLADSQEPRPPGHA